MVKLIHSMFEIQFTIFCNVSDKVCNITKFADWVIHEANFSFFTGNTLSDIWIRNESKNNFILWVFIQFVGSTEV